MTSGCYAVVAYLSGPLAEFVQGLRSQLVPREAHVRPHLTLLAPRVLESPPEKLHSALQRICYKEPPLRVSFGEVESFVPSTSTVYLRIHEGAGELCHLHQRLNQYGFRAEESWPYVAHVTLAKLEDDRAALEAMKEGQRQWSLYAGMREFRIEKLTLVREVTPDLWDDLATVVLIPAALRGAHESTCPESSPS